MEEVKWIYEPMEAQLFGVCDCDTPCGPDNPAYCGWITDHLVVVKP
jgi:hypothetical protein